MAPAAPNTAPVTPRVVASPTSGDWLVRVDGWAFPEHFPLLYPSLEAAQRAAGDVLIDYRPRDCRQVRCGSGCRCRRRGRAVLIG